MPMGQCLASLGWAGNSYQNVKHMGMEGITIRKVEEGGKTEGEKGGKSEPQMPTQARQRGEGPATPHLAHPSASKTEDDQVGLNGCTSFLHFKKEAQHVTTIHVQRIGKHPCTP